MIARRGPLWWGRMHERGFSALVVDCDGALAGYATLGRSRGPGGAVAARSTSSTFSPSTKAAASAAGSSPRPAAPSPAGASTASPSGRSADNEIACRFYRAMGGREAGHAEDRFCGVPLRKTGFAWG